MEIFILLALAFIVVFVLVRISLIILRGKPMLKDGWKKYEKGEDWEEDHRRNVENDPHVVGSKMYRLHHKDD